MDSNKGKDVVGQIGLCSPSALTVKRNHQIFLPSASIVSGWFGYTALNASL